MKMPQLLYIQFWDHGSADEHWLLPNEIKAEGCLCHATGWVIKETKRSIVLGNFLDEEDCRTASRVYIIKGAIIKRRRLKIP